MDYPTYYIKFDKNRASRQKSEKTRQNRIVVVLAQPLTFIKVIVNQENRV